MSRNIQNIPKRKQNDFRRQSPFEFVQNSNSKSSSSAGSGFRQDGKRQKPDYTDEEEIQYDNIIYSHSSQDML